MPLTVTRQLYKNFPGIFADGVTQHVRKRTESYRTASKEDGLDDIEVSDMSRRGALTPFQSAPSSGRPPQDSTAKRTGTPLSTISDGDESENSREPIPEPPKTASRGLKLDLSRVKTPSPSPRGPSKRETPSPQTQGSFSTMFKAIRPRPSPRTTVSLDAVDLWEDDDDSDDGSEFDEINGVVINPCKTFDFSELSRSRSPVACKRNKLENKKLSVAEKLKLNLRKLDSQERVSSSKSSGRVSPGRTGRVSPGRVSPGRVSPGRVSPGRRKSPRELRAWKPRPRMAGRSKTVFPSPEPEPSRCEPELHTARHDFSSALAKSIDGRLPFVRDSPEQKHANEVIPSVKQSPKLNHSTEGKPNNKKTLHNRLLYHRSKTDFSLHQLKEEVEMVSDSTDDSDSLNSTGERHVKFNNLVTVKDVEMNTVHMDSLRNSNNSAQMYKKQYLLPQGWREELPDLSGRSLHA